MTDLLGSYLGLSSPIEALLAEGASRIVRVQFREPLTDPDYTRDWPNGLMTIRMSRCVCTGQPGQPWRVSTSCDGSQALLAFRSTFPGSAI